MMPLLSGLGWDESDPGQVIWGIQTSRQTAFSSDNRVRIALLEKGVPTVFIEANLLDREYDHGYLVQLSKYAPFLLEGGVAVLTNGRFWQVYAIENGKTCLQRTTDVADGEVESAARKLHEAIGKEVISNYAEAASGTPNDRPNRQETSAGASSFDEIRPNPLSYRRDCYQEMIRRGRRGYYIVDDETIERVIVQKPADQRQLRCIQGTSPSTWNDMARAS